MGTRDTKSKEYLADNARFADLCNYKLYDGEQVNEAKKRHENKHDKMSSTEFLSGFKKMDKLTPIIPITLYWGTDMWDAPTHLHEMFGDIDEKLLPFIPNYHVNLVAPSLIDNFDKFKTELGQTLEFIKYSNDTKHFKEMLSNLKNKKLTNETISTINLFTGSNIKIEEEGEVTDVCLAIEEIKKEAAEEAVAEMCLAIEEIKKEAVAKEFIENVENIMDNFHISLEDACRGLKHTVEEYNHAKEFLKSIE